MAKVAYRKIKNSARRARRNPTLLTLVNPGQKGGSKVAKAKRKAAPKKGKKSTKKAAAVSTKKISKAGEAAAKKIAKAGEAAAKKIVKAVKKVKAAPPTGAPAKPRSYGIGEYPRSPYVSGPAGRTQRELKYSAHVGKGHALKKVKRKLPDPGWRFVAGRGAADGEPTTAGYWRYQQNSGGSMKRRGRKAPKRGAKGRFLKMNRPKRAAPKRRSIKRSSAKRNVGRKTRKTRKTRKVVSRRSAKRNVGRKTRKTRKTARRVSRRGMKKNVGRKGRKTRKGARKSYRKGMKRNRRSYKKNSDLKPILVKAGVGFLGFLGGRILANQLATQPMIPAAIRPYAAVLGPVGAAGLVYYLLGQKGPKALQKMRKYQLPLMVGAGVAALDALFTQFAPASIRALIGGGVAAAPALAGWQGTSSYWGDGGSSGSRAMLPGQGYGVQAGMNEYVRDGMSEYVRDGMGEYVMTDEDGVPMGDLYNLDAGVIDDGLFGDPGDDALDIEVLD